MFNCNPLIEKKWALSLLFPSYCGTIKVTINLFEHFQQEFLLLFKQILFNARQLSIKMNTSKIALKLDEIFVFQLLEIGTFLSLLVKFIKIGRIFF